MKERKVDKVMIEAVMETNCESIEEKYRTQ